MKTQLKKNCGRWLMIKNGNNKAIMDEEMVWLTGFIVYSTSRRPRETYIVSNLCFGLTAWVFDGVLWCMTWCQVPILWECHESGFCARCKISLIRHAVWAGTRHTLTSSQAARFWMAAADYQRIRVFRIRIQVALSRIIWNMDAFNDFLMLFHWFETVYGVFV